MQFQDQGAEVDINTTYEVFQKIVKIDQRAENIDTGNMKLTFNSVCIRSFLHILLNAWHICTNTKCTRV